MRAWLELEELRTAARAFEVSSDAILCRARRGPLRVDRRSPRLVTRALPRVPFGARELRARAETEQKFERSPRPISNTLETHESVRIDRNHRESCVVGRDARANSRHQIMTSAHLREARVKVHTRLRD